MLDVSSDSFLYGNAAKDTDGWRLDLDPLGVSEALGEVWVPDVKGAAIEAFVGNDQVAGAPARARGFSLGHGHGGIGALDAASGLGGILPDAFNR